MISWFSLHIRRDEYDCDFFPPTCWGQWSFGVESLTSCPLLWLFLHVLFFLSSLCVTPCCMGIKRNNIRSEGCLFVGSHICFSYLSIPFYILCDKLCGDKAGEMGGTERDSHTAFTIKATLTQTDTQVVQLFSVHAAHISQSKAGKYTFFYSTIVFVGTWNTPWTNLCKSHIFTSSLRHYSYSSVLSESCSRLFSLCCHPRE